MRLPALTTHKLLLGAAWLFPATFAYSQVTFEKDILPIFEKNCAGCHSPQAESLKAELDLSTAAATLKGSEYGEIVKVGNAEESLLVKSLEHTADPFMPPPKKFPPLSKQDIALIRQWIDAGAPSAGTATPVQASPPATEQAAPPTAVEEPPKPESVSTTSSNSTAPVGALAYSPDGKWLAVGGLHTVDLFSIEESGAPKKDASLAGHADLVRALAFSPDGATLAAGGGQPGRVGEVVLWNVSDRTEKGRIAAHKDNLLGLAFSPDGSLLATCSYDKTVAVWNLADRSQKFLLKDHVDAVYEVTFSPDGKTLASSAGDRTIKIWDSESGKRLITLSDSTGPVRAVSYSPDGRYIAGGADDKMIRIWDLQTSGESFRQSSLTSGVLVLSAFAHDGPVLRLVYSRDGDRLISTGNDRALKVWNTADMTELLTLEDQPDWVFALALDPTAPRFAVGRFDSSWGVYSTQDGSSLWKQDPPAKSALARAGQSQKADPRSMIKGKGSTGRVDVDAVIIDGTIPPSIGSLSPVRWHRGSEFEMTVEGKNLAEAQPFFFDSRVGVEVVSSEALPIPEFNYDPNSTGAQIFDIAQPYRVKLKVTLPEDLQPGTQHLAFKTPIGLSTIEPLKVLARPDVGETEPNNQPDQGQALPDFPTTVIGSMNEAGDTDLYRFSAKKGDELVFVLTDAAMNMSLELLDPEGKVLSSGRDTPSGGDPTVAYRFETEGEYSLRVSDRDVRAGVGYRLHAGAFPYVRRVSPLGVPAGPPVKVSVDGFNIGGASELEVDPPDQASGHQTLPLPLPDVLGNPAKSVRLAVGSFQETGETEPNDTPDKAQTVTFPETINGLIESRDSGQDADVYRFQAEQGKPFVIEVLSDRLGASLDSVIEILDEQGQTLQRYNARGVAKSMMTLSDRDSRSSGIRIDDWSDFRINDFVMVGSEILQIFKIPDYADEDVVFKSFHNGQRVGYFGTTPEYHAVNTPLYKVELNDPGKEFPPNGMPTFPVYWRNDDAFFEDDMSKDSLLVFEAPRTADYWLRITDAIASGGPDHVYRLTLRDLKPDFKIFAEDYRVNVFEGGHLPVGIRVQRFEGFEGEVQVEVLDLPAGLSIPADTVLPDQERLQLALSAAPGAESMEEDRAIRVRATARIEGREVTREASLGRVTVIRKKPDVVVKQDQGILKIEPGKSSWLTVDIDRNNDFTSRVPIDVLNLPLGVYVLDTGLNGILVREGETQRKMEIYAEPWVQPLKKKIYIQAKLEPRSAGRMVFISSPIELVTGDLSGS